MPEQSYRPRHNVSRQFTEAELAVSDRTTDHLTQEVDQLPSARLSVHGSTEQAYAWLEKDLKRRDEQTVRLAREMQLAESQSLRNQLDVEARDEADRKASAADGVSYIAAWQENGFRSMEEATQAYKKKNPSMVMNPEFLQAQRSLLDGFKTDQQREIEEINEKTLIARSVMEFEDAEHMRLDMEENPDKWQKIRDAKLIGFEDAAEQAKFDAANRAYGRQQATTNMKLWGMTDPGDGSLAMRQMEALDNAGLKVSDPGRLQSFYKADSPQLQMALDGAYLGRQSPEVKAKIEESLNILTNPKSEEDQIFEARRMIDDQSLAYWKETKVAREAELIRQQVASKLPAASKAASDALKANHSLLKGYKDEAIDADPTILVEGMTSNARAAMNQIKAELISVGVPLDGYSEAILQIEEISKKAQEKARLGYFGEMTGNPETDKEAAKDRIAQASSFSRQINDITNRLLESAMKAERNPVTTSSPVEETGGGKALPTDSPKYALPEVTRKIVEEMKGDPAKIEAELIKRGYDIPPPK